MKRIDKFILRSYLGPFIFTFFIALFILLMQFVWKYVDELVGKGLEWLILGKLLALVAVTMVSLALPLAILLSSLMTFGNLGEYMELTALKASGISLQRAMRPVLIFCLITGISAFYFSNNVLPYANLKMKMLLNEIRSKRPELNIKPGIFNNDITNYVIRIGKKSRDGKELRDIMIYDHTNRMGNDRLIIAEKGVMTTSGDKRYLELLLTNGHTYTEAEPGQKRKGRYPFLREIFSEDLIRFDLAVFAEVKSDENLFKKNYQMLNLNQLAAETDTLVLQLNKDKSYMPGILLRGAYFQIGKKYNKELQNSRIASWNELRNALGNKQQAKDSIHRRKVPGTIFLPDSSNNELPVSQAAEVKPVPLKSRTNVMANFNKTDRIRILEGAANNIRSSKSTLDFSSENFKQEQERIFRHEIEWHRKFTLSFACVLLFLIGAPLGAIVRKGGLGMPVVFSLIFFVLYHMISITGEKLAREAVLTPFWGMWLSSAILLPVGFFLTYKATRDSALFDRDVYLKLFTRKSLPKFLNPKRSGESSEDII